MEPISNLPPLAPSNGTSSLLGKAFGSFSSEMEQLIEMTKNEKLPVANLGGKIDIKA